MKLNINKYFEGAKKRNIDPLEISFSQIKETSVSLFNEDVEEQTIGTSITLSGKGIVNGNLGSFSTDKVDLSTVDILLDNIVSSSLYGRTESNKHFCAGGLKYKKAKVYSKDFVDSTLSEIRKVALDLSRLALKKDKRITKVELGLSKIESEDYKYNTLGLNVKEKSRYYVFNINIIAEENNIPKTGFDYSYSFLSLDEIKLKADEVITLATKRAVDFFNSEPIKSGKYKCVLAPNVFASLLKFFVSGLNAKSCQKHISPFENKLNKQICSKVLTLSHTPHIESSSSTSFDFEGYPTKDFIIINKGILNTYFYSIESALVDSVTPNGCGASLGEASPFVLSVKPTKKSEDELISKIQKGLYISKVSGLNAGIDSQTLNFSLPCEGYEIVEGKLSKSTSMIICAGNLKDLFFDIISVGSNLKDCSSVFTPSVVVKKINISGK